MHYVFRVFFYCCHFTDVDEPIVLINDTPDVEVNEAQAMASVRVDFTLSNDVVFAQCSLGPNFPPIDCESQIISFINIIIS